MTMRPYGAGILGLIVALSGCRETNGGSDGGDAGVVLDAAGCQPGDFGWPMGGYDPCTNDCHRPGGYVCAKGIGMDRCAADDVCNGCDCYSGGVWACTQVLCAVDAGTDRPDGAPPWPYCRSNADCGRGNCKFDIDPREQLGRCSGHP